MYIKVVTKINYKLAMNAGMRFAIAEVLHSISVNGIGSNNILIKFNIFIHGVVMPSNLVSSDEDFVVNLIQDSFGDLTVSADAFTVSLSFPENFNATLTIPFKSIVSLIDVTDGIAIEIEPDFTPPNGIVN